MNRISAVPGSPSSAGATVARVKRPVMRSGCEVATTCVVAPLHYEPNYAYPLVVWLHSSGANEAEVRQIMRLVSLRNYVALGVRGPAAKGNGFQWPQDLDSIGTAEQRVCEAIAAARERFHIHAGRIFIAGYDAAGTMAVRLALRNPDRFSGAASLNGMFPQSLAPLARLPELRSLKLMIAHCRDSQRYTLDRLCRELSLFHSASLSVHLRQYPCDDELTTQMLHDLDGWLMEQVTGMPATCDDAAASIESDWN